MADLSATRSSQDIQLTRHAGVRMQQRGVPLQALHALLDYGHCEPDHKGCQVVTFDAHSWDECPPSGLGQVQGRRLYAVVDSDGIVITAGHRFRRIPRDLSLSSYRPGRSRRQGRHFAHRDSVYQ